MLLLWDVGWHLYVLCRVCSGPGSAIRLNGRCYTDIDRFFDYWACRLGSSMRMEMRNEVCVFVNRKLIQT